MQATSSQGAQCVGAPEGSDTCKTSPAEERDDAQSAHSIEENGPPATSSGHPNSQHSLISHHDMHTALDKESSGGAATEDKQGHSDGATAPASSGKTAAGLEGLHGKGLQHQQSEQSAQPSGEEVLGMGVQWLHSVYRSSAMENAELPKAPNGLQIELLQSLLHGVLSAPSQGNEIIS